MGSLWPEGHSSSILCVGGSPGPEGLIASGAEGGEVTLWTQQGAIVGRLVLPGQEDITSAAFSPADSARLYVSHGDTVSVLDPRNLKGPVENFQGAGEEEINALALNETGSAVAVADDSGAVRILEIPGGRVCRSLRRHTNICSSVAFRPHRPNNLISVGLDMQVILWGLQKTRPLWTLNLQDVAEEEDAHQQRPGGNDGQVALWDLGKHPVVVPEGKTGKTQATASQRRKGKSSGRRKEQAQDKSKKKAEREEAEEDDDEATAKEQEESMEEEKSGPKMSISHGDKVNWLCPAVLKGEPSIIVADQSTNLTVYPLSQL
ncbi:hypothetical protein ILYODFUR_006798 [Ilyodon furcidens]|uniref:WD repeat domain 53 n=1 Tax=Ilyodon furcidens TaxID=33524 RepID=A0ABV0TGJ8_9TELE